MASGVEAPLKSVYHIPHQQVPAATNGIAPAVTLTVRLIMQGKVFNNLPLIIYL